MFVPGVNGSIISNAPTGSRLKGAYKNSKKRKMPNGGLELALDAASFAPPPIGTAASLLGAGLNAYQGDYAGMGLDLASAASGGASKWFGAAAGAAKMANSGRLASSMASKAKTFETLSNPVISKSASVGRDYLGTVGSSPYNNTMRVPQRDNTQVVMRPNPNLKRMPNGGSVLSMGDYDRTTAPKKGNYLLPDINRPSYIDNSGNKRSEYKMGINVNGKETLIPSVVGGRQLTADQAVDRYRSTGLHMGKYNTVDEADYAARLRTARYNMLEDPIRFQANQLKNGGKVDPSNDKDMVNGVASILRRIKDKKNRLQLANQLSKQFDREKVKYDLPSFLAKSKVKK